MGIRSDRIIKWCEKHLYVPDGKLVGQKLKLAVFQKDDLRAIYPDDGNVRRALISRGRKNGKRPSPLTPRPSAPTRRSTSTSANLVGSCRPAPK